MHEHFRSALETLDVVLAKKIWHHVMPHLPQLTSDTEALIVLHAARTAANTITFSKRAYSHSWLMERGYPSQFPDYLRPRAERLYPITIPAVGIAVYNRTPVAFAIRGAMEDAVRDEGVKDSNRTKRAILRARERARKWLLGI